MINSQLFASLLILFTVALNTIAQTFLKLGSGQNILNIYLIGGVFLYGLSTIFYISVLGKFNLSLLYPTVIGLTVVTTTIAGAYFLKEKVNVINWMGLGLIISGIFAVGLGKSS